MVKIQAADINISSNKYKLYFNMILRYKRIVPMYSHSGIADVIIQTVEERKISITYLCS